MDLNIYEKNAIILSILGHSKRLYIVHMLIPKGPLNVSEL